MIRNLEWVAVALLCLFLNDCSSYTPKSSLVIDESASSINAYGTSQLSVHYNVDGGSSTDVTRTAQITISDPTVATINDNGLLTGTGYGGVTTITASYQSESASTTLTVVAAPQVNAWGDNLTAGAGATKSDFSYPSQLTTQMNRVTSNLGISGQTSTQIAARQGGVPIHITLQDNDSPASGQAFASSIDVKFLSTASDLATRTVDGSLGTIRGTVTRTATKSGTSANTEIYSFEQDTGGKDQTIPEQSVFSIDAVQAALSQVNIFWVGRNNFSNLSQVMSDVAAMVGSQTSGKYIVVSVLNGEGEGTGTTNYKEITSLNSALQNAYPDNYLDVRAALVAAYDPSSSQDVTDHNNDIPPASLRFDSINLGDNGYSIVAKQIGAKLTAEGW